MISKIRSKRGATLMEMVVALTISLIFITCLTTFFFAVMQIIAASKEQADAGMIATNLSEVLTNEIAYAYYDNSDNSTAGTIQLDAHSVSFTKTDLTKAEITTKAITDTNGKTIDILYINNEKVYDAKYYKGCSLALDFSQDADRGVVYVTIRLTGNAEYTTSISIKLINKLI